MMNNTNKPQVKRGEVYLVDLGERVGSEQGGIRPVLVIQNDIGNKFAPTLIGVPLTSKVKKLMPTHVRLLKSQYNTPFENIALCEQVVVIDKSRIVNDVPFFKLNELDTKRIDRALVISMGINVAM